MSVQNMNIIKDAMINPSKISGGLGGQPLRSNAKYYYVDGTYGSDAASGTSPGKAKKTIQAAVDVMSKFSVLYVFAKDITDYTGDPTSYAETIIIPYAKSGIAIIGVSRGRTQGGLPQVKIGSGAVALLTIRAPGCLIQNMGFNGVDATGGGILLDDDYAAKSAFGTTIDNCHIKNCVGTNALNGLTGGGIMWSAQGNAWQCSITNNMFYKNAADIVLMGTSSTRPQDTLIQGNIFQSAVTSVCDCNILSNGTGGGWQTITIDSNVFSDVPAVGSAVHHLYLELTGTLGGMVTRNMFGCLTAVGDSELTFVTTGGTGGNIPATVFMAGNFGSFTTGTGAGRESAEVWQT